MDFNISHLSSSPNLISSINIIPAELFSDQSLLNSILGDYDLWSLLGETKQTELLEKHLPQALSCSEKRETVEMLFDHRLSRFDKEPIETIFTKLEIAKISPDSYKMLEDVNKLKRKAFLLEEQERQCKLLIEVLTHRKAIFQLAVNSSPNGIERPHIFDKKNPFIDEISKNMCENRENIKRLFKVKEKYKEELQNLFPGEEISASEDEDDFKFGKFKFVSQYFHNNNPKCFLYFIQILVL